MRAAMFSSSSDATGFTVVSDIEVEALRPHEVQVRVSHCGICHSDISVMDLGGQGQMILGHEAAGVVADVGSGVTTVTPGDKVMLVPISYCGSCYWCSRGEMVSCGMAQSLTTGFREDGTTPFSRDAEPVARGLGVAGFGEVTVVEETAVVRLDADVPLDVVCVIGCSVQTGVGAALNTARVQAGDSVLVIGAGGIGVSVVQGARIAGASRIVVSDPDEGRREAAQRFGATHTVDPTQDDAVGYTQSLTDGRGADVAFEASGFPGLVTDALAAARRGGTAVIVGADVTLTPVEILPIAMMMEGKTLVGTLLGDSVAHRDIPRYLDLWRAGQLDLEGMITHRFDLDDINDGLATMRATEGLRSVVSLGKE